MDVVTGLELVSFWWMYKTFTWTCL